MNWTKVILFVIYAIVALVAFCFTVKALFEEGYSESEVREILRRRRRGLHDWVGYGTLRRKDFDYSSEKKPPMEHETADLDSYASDCGSYLDPESAALMNISGSRIMPNNKLLASGGWKCGCGRVNASYTSSCVCGKSKHGETVPEAVPVHQPSPAMDDPVNNTEIANAAAIREYKKLMDDGIITAEEFEVKKKQLLGL